MNEAWAEYQKDLDAYIEQWREGLLRHAAKLKKQERKGNKRAKPVNLFKELKKLSG